MPRARLDQHLSKKDFWTHLILFTSKDVNLAKAHIRYTESQLYQLAQQAKRAEIDNETTPQLPALSEADTADAEAFLDDMRLIYPMLGVSALEPAEEIAPSTDRLRLEGSDARAEGRDTPEGFVVFEWSLARRDTVRSLADWGNWVIGIRESLVQQGLLVADNSHLRLTQNYVFKSPSAAAGVMLGRTANRLVEWKDEQGRTLKQIGEEALGDQETSDPASEPELEISEAL